MYDQTLSLIAMGVFALTILIVAVIIRARFRLDSNDSLIVKWGVSSLFLILAALAWALCYMGFVSGVAMSINRWHHIENDLASNPASYWVALAFAYFLGVVFLSAGTLILFARKAEE